MLNIRYSTKFKKDYKRCSKRGYNLKLLEDVINTLRIPEQLPSINKNHTLSGNWIGYNECHIQPDWLLIYKTEDNELLLARTGSHSDLLNM